MNDASATRNRRFATASWAVLALHAVSLVLLCWQQKLTPDEANSALAGCIVRQHLQWATFNTVFHGPLALWPTQLGVLVADPSDFAAYVPWGRLGSVLFTVLAAVALRRIAERAFGEPAAFAVLVVWSTNPLVLANGCLMTADMALTCTSLWTVERTWRFLLAPTWTRLVLVGITLGLTLSTKYLGLLLLPAMALALTVALTRGFTPRLALTRQRDGVVPRIVDAGLATVVVAVVAALVLYSTYLWRVPGFRVNLPPPGLHVAPEDPTFGPKSTMLRALVELPLVPTALRLLPEPWVRGIDYQQAVSEGLPAFFGDRVGPGFWQYYAVAFGVKLPIVFLLLVLVGLVVRAPRWPPWLPTVVVFAVGVPLVFLSGITRLQIGVRYALSAVPFLCLVAGRGLTRFVAAPSRVARMLGIAAIGMLVVDAARTWPRFLPAFNALAPRPYLWFKDSTLDWHVDSPATDLDLAALRARHPHGRQIEGSLGPCFGTLLIHGEQLAPRDSRDPGYVYHWLRRFWPADAVGAWFAFTVDEASFRAALHSDRTHAGRGRVELAVAFLGTGDFESAEALLDGSHDQDAAAVCAAMAELRSGDLAREAAALAQLGRNDLVLARGDGAPRALRAHALLLARQPQAVVDLLGGEPDRLEGSEIYILGTALTSCGRGRDAIALLERSTPADPAHAAVHAQIVRRLQDVVSAAEQMNPALMRR